MNKQRETPLVDIQSTHDERNIPIDRVGVRDVKYPMFLRVRGGGLQHTVGNFTLTVDLPRNFKGTHMSRFIEVLSEHSHDLSIETIPDILARLRKRLAAKNSHLQMRFIFFREKAAPVTGKTGMMGYLCGFDASGGDHDDFVHYLEVPVTTLCPCSKEISSRGAHNQRGVVRVRVRANGLLWLEEVIDLIEACGSCQLYPVLKRPDEKFVTEHAYDNPRFVEDMVREVALAFDAEDRIRWYEIEAENFESIHDHNAYASLRREKS